MNTKSITLSKSLSCTNKFKKFNMDSEIIKLENKKEQLLNAIKDRQARQFKKLNTQKQIEDKKQKLYNLQQDSNKIQIQLNKRQLQLQKIQKKINENHTKRIQFIKQVDQDYFDQGEISQQKQLKYQLTKDRIYMKLIDRQLSINRHLKQLIKHSQQNKQHQQLSQSNNLDKTIQLKFNKMLIRYCINNGAILSITSLNKNNRNKRQYFNNSFQQQQTSWKIRRQLRIRQWQQNWNNNVKQIQQQQQQQIDLWQDISLDVLNQLQRNRDVYDDQDYQQLFPQPQYCNNHKQVNKPTRENSQNKNNQIIQSNFYKLYKFIIKNDLVIEFKQYLLKQIQNTIQNLQIDQNSIIKTNLTIEIDGLINDLSQLKKVKTIQKKKNRKINNDNNNNIYVSQTTTTTTEKYTRTLSKLIDKKIDYRQSIFKQHKMLNHQLLSMREIIQKLQRQQQEINRIKVQVSKQVQSSQRQLQQYDLCNQYDRKQNPEHLVNDIQQIDSAIIYLKSKYSDKSSNKQNNNSLLQNSLISSNNKHRQQLTSKRTTTSIQQALQKSNQTNYQNIKDNHKFLGLNKVQSMVNINHNSSIKLTLNNHDKTRIYQYQQQQQQQRFLKNNINNKSTLSLLHRKKSINSRQENQNQQNTNNSNNNNKQNKINNQLRTPSIPNSPKIKFSSSQQTTDCKSPLILPLVQSTNKQIYRNCSKSKHNNNTLLMTKSSSLKQLKNTNNNKNNNIYDFMTKKITVTNNKSTNKLKLL